MLEEVKSSFSHSLMFAQSYWAYFISVYFRKTLFEKEEAQEWIDLYMKNVFFTILLICAFVTETFVLVAYGLGLLLTLKMRGLQRKRHPKVVPSGSWNSVSHFGSLLETHATLSSHDSPFAAPCSMEVISLCGSSLHGWAWQMGSTLESSPSSIVCIYTNFGHSLKLPEPPFLHL